MAPMNHSNDRGSLKGTRVAVEIDGCVIGLAAFPTGRKSCLVMETQSNYPGPVMSRILKKNLL